MNRTCQELAVWKSRSQDIVVAAKEVVEVVDGLPASRMMENELDDESSSSVRLVIADNPAEECGMMVLCRWRFAGAKVVVVRKRRWRETWERQVFCRVVWCGGCLCVSEVSLVPRLLKRVVTGAVRMTLCSAGSATGFVISLLRYRRTSQNIQIIPRLPTGRGPSGMSDKCF